MTQAPHTERGQAGDTWQAVAPLFAEAVRGYHAVRGRDASSDAAARNVRINSDLVPGRGRLLLDLLHEAGVSIEGARVLDTGSGFGALTAYLAAEGRPAQMVASDVRADLLALGSACVGGMPELSARLDFAVADVRDMSRWTDGSFDVVLLTGVAPYLTRHDLGLALSEVARVLRPGGHVLLYETNRWWPVDRFTGRPLVHLLPRVRDRGRVRTRSLPETRRHLRRAGLAPVAAAGFARDRRVARPVRAFGSAFGIVARAQSA